MAQFAGLCGSAKDKSFGRLEGTQDFREFAVAQRPDDHEVVRERLVISPQLAAQHGNSGRMFLRLPARGQQPCKICFVGQDQYACASQKWPAPRRDFSAITFRRVLVTTSLLRRAPTVSAWC